MRRSKRIHVQPATTSPRQQCAAPLPCSFQEQQIEAGIRDGPHQSQSSPARPHQHGVSFSVSFPPSLFHFALLALAWFGVWVFDPAVLVRKQTSPSQIPIPPPPPKPTCHTCFPLFFTSPSFSVCLSTHLSSQRILHWSNECANSACCIKCGHPNKLHPLQGIGSEVILESPPGARLHRFTCSCQSPKPITTPEVDVLISRAVFLQQHNPKFDWKVAL